MSTERRAWSDNYELLPWERVPGEQKTGGTRETNETDKKPVLYLPDGTALTRRRPLGFRPDDVK